MIQFMNIINIIIIITISIIIIINLMGWNLNFTWGSIYYFNPR